VDQHARGGRTSARRVGGALVHSPRMGRRRCSGRHPLQGLPGGALARPGAARGGVARREMLVEPAVGRRHPLPPGARRRRGACPAPRSAAGAARHCGTRSRGGGAGARRRSTRHPARDVGSRRAGTGGSAAPLCHGGRPRDTRTQHASFRPRRGARHDARRRIGRACAGKPGVAASRDGAPARVFGVGGRRGTRGAGLVRQLRRRHRGRYAGRRGPARTAVRDRGVAHDPGDQSQVGRSHSRGRTR